MKKRQSPKQQLKTRTDRKSMQALTDEQLQRVVGGQTGNPSIPPDPIIPPDPVIGSEGSLSWLPPESAVWKANIKRSLSSVKQ